MTETALYVLAAVLSAVGFAITGAYLYQAFKTRDADSKSSDELANVLKMVSKPARRATRVTGLRRKIVKVVTLNPGVTNRDVHKLLGYADDAYSGTVGMRLKELVETGVLKAYAEGGLKRYARIESAKLPAGVR